MTRSVLLAGLLVAVVAAAPPGGGQKPTGGALVPVTFTHLPRDVTAVTLYEWPDGPMRASRAQVPITAGSVTIDHSSGDRLVVMFARPGGAYLLDGPLTWPARPEVRAVDRQWRRTIQGSAAGPTTRPFLEWISPQPVRDGPWPHCRWADDRFWECWGVPRDAAGVVAAGDGDRVLWTAVSSGARAASPLRAARWGRLLVAHTAAGTVPAKLTVAIARPVPPPPERFRSIRLAVSLVADAHATPVEADAVWIEGAALPPGAWIEARAPGYAPTYLDAELVAAGARQIPLDIVLDESRTLSGIVSSAGGETVAGALVTLSRLIDPAGNENAAETRATGSQPPSASRAAPRPRRVFTAETTTGADGRFMFEGLADVDYEILAWHGQLGRASVRVRGGEPSLRIRLASAATARGRVTIGGRPAAGIPVVSVPNMEVIGDLDDPLDAKGGDAKTGADGRFLVALPPRGGGELRIGGGEHGIRRVPVPAAAGTAGVDVGDIDLAEPIVVTFVLDRDPGCDLVAIGPLGRAGLQIVQARRTAAASYEADIPEEGQWQLVLTCGRTERAVLPAAAAISAHGEKTIALRVQ